MSEFTGSAGRSLDQLMIEYQAAANAFRDGDDHQVAQSLCPPAEANLLKRTGICGVFQLLRRRIMQSVLCLRVAKVAQVCRTPSCCKHGSQLLF